MKMFLYYDINERKALEKYLKGAEIINKTALKTAGAIISSVRSCVTNLCFLIPGNLINFPLIRQI